MQIRGENPVWDLDHDKITGRLRFYKNENSCEVSKNINSLRIGIWNVRRMIELGIINNPIQKMKRL